MTSTELKHQARLQEWSAAVKDCRSNGFVLLYKRLESGGFQWPRNEAEVRELTPQQYRWLMEGLQIDQPKAHKPVSGLSIV